MSLSSCCSVYLAAHGRYAQKLMTDLFSNYTNALRPVEDTDHIINVTLQITLSQIIDMVILPAGPDVLCVFMRVLMCVSPLTRTSATRS